MDRARPIPSRPAALAALVAAVLSAAPAAAGNDHSYFLSSEAALAGGAVIANTSGAGALWYNPAGLARGRRATFDVSGSAFVLRFRNTQDAVRVHLSEDEADPRNNLRTTDDLRSTELISVPTALVLTRQVTDDLQLAFGVFVPEQDTLFARIDSNIEFAGGIVRYRQQVVVLEQTQRYHVGPAVGWALSDTLRLGFALYGVYESIKSTSRVWLDLGINDPTGAETTRVTLIGDTEFDATRIGGQAVGGLQAQLEGGLHLGLVVRSPIMQFHDSTTELALLSYNEQGETPALVFDRSDGADDSFAQVRPLQVHVGIAIERDWGWFGVSADYQPALSDPARGVDRETVWNAQAGFRHDPSKTLRWGMGAFTDHSASETPTDIGDDQVDYYGLAGGVTLRTPLSLAEDPDPEALVFESTFGLRYAYGQGEAGGLLFDFTNEEGDDFLSSSPSDVTFHEVALTIGSSLLF